MVVTFRRLPAIHENHSSEDYHEDRERIRRYYFSRNRDRKSRQ